MPRHVLSGMEGDGLSYREYAPPSSLREGVLRSWSFEEFHPEGAEEHRVPPDTHVDLSFFHGEAWHADAEGRLQPLPPVFVFGLRSGPVRIVSRGLTRMVGVRLHPWRAAHLFHPSVAPRGISLDPGPELLALSARIRALLGEGDSDAALELLESQLLERQSEADRALRAVEAAGLQLYATDGAARIGALAAMLGLSVRQLERRFKEGTGLPPKAFARLVRFSRVSERLERHPDERLTELAFEFGYADQAHFIREFRTFAGVSPSRFATEARRAARSEGADAK